MPAQPLGTVTPKVSVNSSFGVATEGALEGEWRGAVVGGASARVHLSEEAAGCWHCGKCTPAEQMAPGSQQSAVDEHCLAKLEMQPLALE